MSPNVIVLRLIHIGGGIYWAGTIFFFTTYLEPALRALGPDGGKVMIKLFERRFLNVVPAIAFLTLASGAWLMWITSGGFDPVWTRSALGMALQAGGTLAIIAFLVGVFVMRPAAAATWELAKKMPTADDATRGALTAEMGRLRARSVLAARIIFALLAATVTLMAAARYL